MASRPTVTVGVRQERPYCNIVMVILKCPVTTRALLLMNTSNFCEDSLGDWDVDITPRRIDSWERRSPIPHGSTVNRMPIEGKIDPVWRRSQVCRDSRAPPRSPVRRMP